MHSWVFRNRARLEAIYGRLQADRRPGTGVFRTTDDGSGEELVDYELFPLPRFVHDLP